MNRTTGVATVTMEEGKSLTREAVEKLFKDTRYKVTDFKHVEGPDLKEPLSFTASLEGLKADESTGKLIDKLNEIEGVASVTLKDSTATIKMKDGETLTKEAVDAALKDTAYKCAKLEPVSDKQEVEAENKSSEDKGSK